MALNTGGSGFFVSESGLVVTTQHGLAEHLANINQDLSSKNFLARNKKQEIPLKGLALQVLLKVDVRGVGPDDPQAVEFDRGARRHRYRTKTYNDVRLVFCPESQIAYFGGQMDNFEYPRFCLDFAVLRVYENGRPASPPAYLRLGKEGPAEGEKVFTAGHPRTSERTSTVAHLEFLRDKRYPMSLDYLRRLELVLLDYSGLGPEQQAQARPDLDSVHHARKLYAGILSNLQDPALLEARRKQEAGLSQPQDSQDPWQLIAGRAAHYEKLYERFYLIAAGKAFNSHLFEQAQKKLRGEEVEQVTTPPALERVKLAQSLTFLVDWLGAEEPLVREILAGRSPEERAAELVDQPEAMADLVRRIEPEVQRIEKAFKKDVLEPVEAAYREISKATSATGYPEATGTLRLGFGVVRGYREGERQVPYRTTYADLFARAHQVQNQPPWQLSTDWQKDSGLPRQQGLNFVATLDVQDGSGGGPVVNRAGEVVGLVFDANRWGLGSDFFYDEEAARAVCLDVGGLKAALRQIYGANELLAEF